MRPLRSAGNSRFGRFARLALCGAVVPVLAGSALVITTREASSGAASPMAPAECLPGDTSATAPPAESLEPPSSPGAAGDQTLSVEVPPGRLYLEPAYLSISVPSTTDTVQLPDVLVGDLRDDTGWQLSLTVTSLHHGGDAAVAQEAVIVTPARPRLIAGRPGGVRRGAPARIPVGGCMVLATAGPGSSRATYFQTATIQVQNPGVPGDTELRVDFRLTSTTRPGSHGPRATAPSH